MIVFLLVCIGIAVLAAYVGMLAEQRFNFTFIKGYLENILFSQVYS